MSLEHPQPSHHPGNGFRRLRDEPPQPLPPRGSSSGPPSPGMRRRRKRLTTITNIGGGCAWASRSRSPRPAPRRSPFCRRSLPSQSTRAQRRPRRPSLPPCRGAWPRREGGFAAAGCAGPPPDPRVSGAGGGEVSSAAPLCFLPARRGSGESGGAPLPGLSRGAVVQGLAAGWAAERWGPGAECGPVLAPAPGRRGNPRSGGARQAAGGPERSLPAVRCQGRAARRSYSGEWLSPCLRPGAACSSAVLAGALPPFPMFTYRCSRESVCRAFLLFSHYGLWACCQAALRGWAAARPQCPRSCEWLLAEGKGVCGRAAGTDPCDAWTLSRD